LYSAIEDRTVHFHLLHARDGAPVEQRIVRKQDGAEVSHEEIRKALELSQQQAVILQPKELASLEPRESRDIEVCRFIAPGLLSDQWYERSYYLGPDGDLESYFALAAALERKQVTGIVRWVMRKKEYLGAINVHQGYLSLTTLRRADQVLSFSGVQPAKAATPRADELKLAEQLVASIAGDFEPELWHNEYRERLCKLIEAKARGEKPAQARHKKRAPKASLAQSLAASIAAATKEKKVA
jgi:DNA end-binding protein Ku